MFTLKNYLIILYANLDRSKNVISFQRHVQSRADFRPGVKKRTAKIKTSRIVRRSITSKIFHKYAVLCEGNTTIGAFSIMIVHGQINFVSKPDKD